MGDEVKVAEARERLRRAAAAMVAAGVLMPESGVVVRFETPVGSGEFRLDELVQDAIVVARDHARLCREAR
jgi:hypothetical protein